MPSLFEFLARLFRSPNPSRLSPASLTTGLPVPAELAQVHETDSAISTPAAT